MMASSLDKTAKTQVDKRADGRLGCKPASRADARRACIIEAARKLFAENGFHNTGMAQIARDSGVLVGQIYRDFASKEAIVAAIVERDVREYLAPERLHAAVSRADVEEARQWVRRYIAGRAIEDPRLVAEIMAESARNPRIAEIFQRFQIELGATIRAAVALLTPPDCDPERCAELVDVIQVLSSGVFQRRLRGDAGGIEPVVDSLFAMVEREIERIC